jgi:hypothetical protein
MPVQHDDIGCNRIEDHVLEGLAGRQGTVAHLEGFQQLVETLHQHTDFVRPDNLQRLCLRPELRQARQCACSIAYRCQLPPHHPPGQPACKHTERDGCKQHLLQHTVNRRKRLFNWKECHDKPAGMGHPFDRQQHFPPLMVPADARTLVAFEKPVQERVRPWGWERLHDAALVRSRYHQAILPVHQEVATGLSIRPDGHLLKEIGLSQMRGTRQRADDDAPPIANRHRHAYRWGLQPASHQGLSHRRHAPVQRGGDERGIPVVDPDTPYGHGSISDCNSVASDDAHTRIEHGLQGRTQLDRGLHGRRPLRHGWRKR